MPVGLLGLQGAFLDHRKHLTRLSRTWRIVRNRDDLGSVDRLIIPEAPLDILAQQIVAACAADSWEEDAIVMDVEGDRFADPSKVHAIALLCEPGQTYQT